MKLDTRIADSGADKVRWTTFMQGHRYLHCGQEHPTHASLHSNLSKLRKYKDLFWRGKNISMFLITDVT